MAAVAWFFYIFCLTYFQVAPTFSSSIWIPRIHQQDGKQRVCNCQHVSHKSISRFLKPKTGLRWVSGPPHFVPSILAQDTPITSLTVFGNKHSQGIPCKSLINQFGSRKNPLPNAAYRESHKCGNPM